MNRAQLTRLLTNIAEGTTSPEQGLEQLRFLPYEDLGFARIDHHRSLRQGVPEVIYGAGKTVEQVRAIGERILQHGSDLLATRLEPPAAEALVALAPQAEYNPIARTVVVRQEPQRPGTVGIVLVAAAGTSDLPVAEEAAVTARALGSTVQTVYDVGVAGLHRLLAQHALLVAARVLVVVAGMEGALPSVVGGLVDKPVIAVPTSVGYGAHFHGLAPLLAMLNSCASGIAVVNIDNGFGAGYMAHTINLLGEPQHQPPLADRQEA
ncbi:MAG: nickel pincer cofactor biosynthesis protein LarB [Candidatus Tectimicrobiota bacterium]